MFNLKPLEHSKQETPNMLAQFISITLSLIEKQVLTHDITDITLNKLRVKQKKI